MKDWWELRRGVIIWWGSYIILNAITVFTYYPLLMLTSTPVGIAACWLLAKIICTKFWHEDVF